MQTSTLFAVLEFQSRGPEFMVGGIVRTIVYSVQHDESVLLCLHQKAASGSKGTDSPFNNNLPMSKVAPNDKTEGAQSAFKCRLLSSSRD